MISKRIRKESRTTAVLPVRIYGMDAAGKPFHAVAHTLNVSKSGALLANIDVALTVGDVIGVQKGVYKSKFRVRWIGQKGSSSQGQVGLECLEGAKNIWGAEERPHSLKEESDGAERRGFVRGFDRERRTARRYPCDLGAQILQSGAEVKLWSRCTDISEGGCYIDSRSPLAVNAQFQLTMFLESDTLTMPAVVRTSFPGMGMGVSFQFASEDEAVILRRFLRQKFGELEAECERGEKTGFPALEKLSECVEQLRAWAAGTELEEDDRGAVEEFAFSLRQELQGLRAEINGRAMARTRKAQTHKVPV